MPDTTAHSPIYDQLLAEQHPSRRAVLLRAQNDVAAKRETLALAAYAAAFRGWHDDLAVSA